MNVLVINCGSSSLKYQLVDMRDEHVLAKGLCERIGMEGSRISGKTGDGRSFKETTPMEDHTAAFAKVAEALLSGDSKVIDSPEDIHAIGHRVVHGGDRFTDSVLIDKEVMETIRHFSFLAPLHNPANLQGIEACIQVFGEDKPQVAVFDTAFHSTMPEQAYTYAIPEEYASKYSLRKYGFHGTSHKYLTERYGDLTGSLEGKKIITCHLGNGSSIAAIQDGKVIDTSMGVTPLDGLIMGTRTGAIDPSAVLFLQVFEQWGPTETSDFLNKQCGLLGVSGLSSDMRDNLAAAEDGNERAKLATELLFYQIRKFIGSYVSALNGVDAIIFAGGIGENSAPVRKAVLEQLTWLGVTVDDTANEKRGEEIKISGPDSKVEVWVIPTNEELAIARDVKRLAGEA